MRPQLPVAAALVLFPLACLLAAHRPDYGCPVLALASVLMGFAMFLWILSQDSFLDKMAVGAVSLGVCVGSGLVAALVRESAES